MRRILLSATLLPALVALLSAGLIGTVAAAPKDTQTNVEHITVDCEGLGEIEVVTKANSVTAFGPDGEVYVAKRFQFEQTITVTTFDDVVFGPFEDSFTEGARGKGFEGRIIECTFPADFSDTFTVSAEDAEFFGIPASYIGTEATIEGAGTGTAWIIAPGR